jgi:hypothetical protein
LLIFPQVPQMVTAESAAATGVVQGRAELPPPEQAGAGAVEAEPAPSGDVLPIFEAARSDWFAPEPDAPAPLPFHQRRQRVPGSDGDGRQASRLGAGPPPPPTPPPTSAPEERAYRTAQFPPPPPAAPASSRPDPVQAADEQTPLYQAGLRDDTPPPYRPAPQAPAQEPRPPYRPAPVAETPPSPAAGVLPEQGERLTQAGLPRRIPRTNMAPEMVADQPASPDPAPTGPPPGRSPEEVRSMLSSYRTGIQRGRTVAGGSDPDERPPKAP